MARRYQKGELLYACAIPGRCYVKKNTQRSVYISGKGLVRINSAKYSRWQTIAQAIMIRAKRGLPISRPLVATFSFYFKDRQAQADLSNLIEGPQDELKKVGVIVDDRLIVSLGDSAIYFDDGPARVEVELYEAIETMEG
jgi:Holliday junction resolvase RusA-like endonuclease